MNQLNDNVQPPQAAVAPLPASLIQLVSEVKTVTNQMLAAQLIAAAWDGSMAELFVCRRQLTLADAVHRSTAVLDAAAATFVALMSKLAPHRGKDALVMMSTGLSFAVSTFILLIA